MDATQIAWRSPLIWGDLYLIEMYAFVRALDKSTGETRWEVQRSDLGANHFNYSRELNDAVHTSPEICVSATKTCLGAVVPR